MVRSVYIFDKLFINRERLTYKIIYKNRLNRSNNKVIILVLEYDMKQDINVDGSPNDNFCDKDNHL